MQSETVERLGRHVLTATEQRHCEQHGAYEAKLWQLESMPKPPTAKPWSTFLAPFWSKCPTCDADLQREADTLDAEIRGGMTEKQRRAAMAVAAAGIPARFADSTIWNWQHAMDQQKRVWDWAREYANAFDLALSSGRSGLFSGQPGTGKTHLAIGLLRHIIEKGGSGLYVTVMEMLGRIKATFHREAHESEPDVIEAFATCDLLVIDEVGRSLDTNYELAQFFRILDKRYLNIKPTILVSNLNATKLREFLGDAITDRLRESGGALLTFDWLSHRSSKRPES